MLRALSCIAFYFSRGVKMNCLRCGSTEHSKNGIIQERQTGLRLWDKVKHLSVGCFTPDHWRSDENFIPPEQHGENAYGGGIQQPRSPLSGKIQKCHKMLQQVRRNDFTLTKPTYDDTKQNVRFTCQIGHHTPTLFSTHRKEY